MMMDEEWEGRREVERKKHGMKAYQSGSITSAISTLLFSFSSFSFFSATFVRLGLADSPITGTGTVPPPSSTTDTKSSNRLLASALDFLTPFFTAGEAVFSKCRYASTSLCIRLRRRFTKNTAKLRPSRGSVSIAFGAFGTRAWGVLNSVAVMGFGGSERNEGKEKKASCDIYSQRSKYKHYKYWENEAK
jgi:hypothetical protein